MLVLVEEAIRKLDIHLIFWNRFYLISTRNQYFGKDESEVKQYLKTIALFNVPEFDEKSQ